MLPAINQNTLRMTSLEIADLVQSRHDVVKKSIERLITKAVIIQPPLEDVPGHDAMGRPRTTQVYIFADEQGRRDSIVVVAQLSPEFTAALVDRWQELERQAQLVTPALPQSFADALRLAADQAERIEQQQARLAAIEPKAAALDVIDSSVGSLCVRDTAKTLGITQNKFVTWCIKHHWLYRNTRKNLVAFSNRLQQGFMEQRAVTYFDKNKKAHTTIQPMFTAKGLAHLAKTFAIIHEVA